MVEMCWGMCTFQMPCPSCEISLCFLFLLKGLHLPFWSVDRIVVFAYEHRFLVTTSNDLLALAWITLLLAFQRETTLTTTQW